MMLMIIMITNTTNDEDTNYYIIMMMLIIIMAVKMTTIPRTMMIIGKQNVVSTRPKILANRYRTVDLSHNDQWGLFNNIFNIHEEVTNCLDTACLLFNIFIICLIIFQLL